MNCHTSVETHMDATNYNTMFDTSAGKTCESSGCHYPVPDTKKIIVPTIFILANLNVPPVTQELKLPVITAIIKPNYGLQRMDLKDLSGNYADLLCWGKLLKKIT